jgi:hypothetical protein
MRKPTRFALRWGAPVALAAAAIAALFVVPVFGGNRAVTQRSLKNQVQAKEKRIGSAGIRSTKKTVGTMSLSPGNYEFMTNYQVVRFDPKVSVSCQLSISGIGDFGPTAEAFGPDVATSQAVPTIESGALSGGSHVANHATAKLRCQTSHGLATLNDVSIIALKVPKLTVRKRLAPGKK